MLFALSLGRWGAGASLSARDRPRGPRRACRKALKSICSHEAADRVPRPAAKFRVRRARVEDAVEVAELCAEAFPFLGLRQQLAWGLFRSFFPPRTTAEWQQRLERAFEAKAAAVAAYQQMRARGELYWGRGSLLEPQATSQRQYLQRNMVRRGFFCLLATDPQSGATLGTLAVSLARPQAALPPPFPTQARLQLYVSNVVVRPEARRQGVATALLQASEQLASRVGLDSVWLHVEASNEPGVQLYRGAGYSVVRRDPEWVPGSAFLMTKAVQPALKLAQCSRGGASQRARGGGGNIEAAVGRTRGADGVFVWEVSSGEQRQQQEQQE